MMKLLKKSGRVCRIINIAIILILAVLLTRLIEERVILNKYVKILEQTIGVTKPFSDGDIIKIRDYIYNDVEHMQIEHVKTRPKVGWRVARIIKKREGLCGEGTRLLYHIYRKGGVESRRLYFHGNKYMHVLLEVKKSDKMWYLLETINGPDDDFKEMLSADYKIEELFSFGPYRYHVVPGHFFDNYNYYNFSYLPLNGAFNNKVFKTEIFVHQPVPKIINLLLETHDLFLFLLFILFGLFYNLTNVKTYFSHVLGK